MSSSQKKKNTTIVSTVNELSGPENNSMLHSLKINYNG